MKEIIAQENGWLTQATLEDEASRIFVRKVMTPNPEMWRNADASEKEAWEAEHQPEELGE